MILVSEKMMTPRTVDVITLIDKEGHYIYASRNIYDNALIFDYTNSGNVTAMEKAVLGATQANKVNPDLLDIAMSLYTTIPEPLGMLVPFMLLAANITVPANLTPFEKKVFGYNLIDTVTSSVDTRSYVKMPEAMRAPLVGLQHIANTYKDRVTHAMGLWFTGIEIVPIHEVEIVRETSESVAVVPTRKEQPKPAQEAPSAPLPIPAGSITKIPAAGKDTAEPQANEISQEAYDALMKRLNKINEDTEANSKQLEKKKKETGGGGESEGASQKKVEVSMEQADRASISSTFDQMLEGL